MSAPSGTAPQGAVFSLRRSRWALVFLVPLSPRRPIVEVTSKAVVVRMGVLGGAVVPLAIIERVATMPWPWWGGVGARIGRGLVAFVAGSGEAAVLELSEEVAVRAPLRWRTRRVVIGPEDLGGFLRALGQARRAVDERGR